MNGVEPTSMSASSDDFPNGEDRPFPEHIINDPGLKWLYTPHPDDTPYNKYLGIDREGRTTVRCRRTGRIGYLVATIPPIQGQPAPVEDVIEEMLDRAVDDEMKRRHPETYREPKKGTA